MAAVLAEQHFAALAAGDTSLAARCIHPAHVNHMAADEPAACATPGVPGFLATSAWLRLAFSDLSFEIIELTADADRTMAHVRLTGRQTGPFVVFPPGARPVVFAPTGRAFGVRQVHVFRHRDGRHGEHTAVRDDLSMMTQLGHLPPSPRVARRMARTALTGYRARAVREAIRVSTDAAAGAAAAMPSHRSLRAAPRHELARSSHLNMPCLLVWPGGL
jgi:predicted ester cyclase